MKVSRIVFMVLVVTALMLSQSWAAYIADITYTYTNNGGGNYTFNLTVNNNSTGSDTGTLSFFDVFFDADPDNSNYSNISWLGANGWATDAAEFDPSFGGIPGYALADDSIFGSNGGGIAQGDDLSGFRINFDYSGPLDPRDHTLSYMALFGVSDQDNGGQDLGGFWASGVVDGNLRYVPATPPSVPEPSTMVMVGAGLVGLYAARKKVNL